MSGNEPFLKVKIGTNKSEKTFYSIEELEEWFKKEQEFWTWPEPKPRSQNLTKFFNKLTEHFPRIENKIREYKNPPSPSHSPEMLKSALDKVINSAYDPQCGKLLISSEPRAQFIKQIVSDNLPRAAFALAFFMDYGFRQSREHGIFTFEIAPDVLDGAVTAILFEHGIKDNFQPEKSALEQLRQEWDQECEKAKKANAITEQAAAEWKRQADEELDKQQQMFKALMDKSQADVDGFKKLIKAEIALKGPVTYWKDKGKKHNCASWLYAIATVFSFVGVGYFFYLIIASFGPELQTS